jgi:hypothetical protein
MNVQYYVLQFVGNTLRGKGRPIGVIASKDGATGFRAIGVRPTGSVDTSYFAALLATQQHAWVYREWIEWLKAVIATEEHTTGSIQPALKRLVTADCCIVPGECGSVDIDGALDDALGVLFKRFVRVPRRVKPDPFVEFLGRLPRVLGQAEQILLSDVEVEFAAGDQTRPAKINVAFLKESEPRTVIMRIWNNDGRRQSIKRQVDEAATVFETAIEHGFVDRDHCVVLTTPLVRREVLLAPLSPIARVIDITHPLAVDDILAILARD